MNISTIILVILLLITTSSTVYLYLQSKKPEIPMIPLSPDQKRDDMELVCQSINESINKTMCGFLSKDITFSENSKVGNLFKGHYRNFISYLLRPDVTFLDNGEEKPFITYFISKVYMTYISETSQTVKSLLFKYYSGFSPINYFTRTKKSQPSALNFITEYTTNFLWNKFYENENAQQELYERLQNTNEDANKLTEWLNDYDMEQICKITLNTYNITGAGNTKKIIQQQAPTQSPKKETKEVNNEFSFKFNEQGK